MSGGRRRYHLQRGAKDAVYASRLASTGPPVITAPIDGIGTTGGSSHPSALSAASCGGSNISGDASATDSIVAPLSPGRDDGRRRTRRRVSTASFAGRGPSSSSSSSSRRVTKKLWDCEACTFQNSFRRKKCEMCGFARTDPASMANKPGGSAHASPRPLDPTLDPIAAAEDNGREKVVNEGGISKKFQCSDRQRKVVPPPPKRRRRSEGTLRSPERPGVGGVDVDAVDLSGERPARRRAGSGSDARGMVERSDVVSNAANDLGEPLQRTKRRRRSEQRGPLSPLSAGPPALGNVVSSGAAAATGGDCAAVGGSQCGGKEEADKGGSLPYHRHTSGHHACAGSEDSGNVPCTAAAVAGRVSESSIYKRGGWPFSGLVAGEESRLMQTPRFGDAAAPTVAMTMETPRRGKTTTVSETRDEKEEEVNVDLFSDVAFRTASRGCGSWSRGSEDRDKRRRSLLDGEYGQGSIGLVDGGGACTLVSLTRGVGDDAEQSEADVPLAVNAMSQEERAGERPGPSEFPGDGLNVESEVVRACDGGDTVPLGSTGIDSSLKNLYLDETVPIASGDDVRAAASNETTPPSSLSNDVGPVYCAIDDSLKISESFPCNGIVSNNGRTVVSEVGVLTDRGMEGIVALSPKRTVLMPLHSSVQSHVDCPKGAKDSLHKSEGMASQSMLIPVVGGNSDAFLSQDCVVIDNQLISISEDSIDSDKMDNDSWTSKGGTCCRADPAHSSLDEAPQLQSQTDAIGIHWRKDEEDKRGIPWLASSKEEGKVTETALPGASLAEEKITETSKGETNTDANPVSGRADCTEPRRKVGSNILTEHTEMTERASEPERLTEEMDTSSSILLEKFQTVNEAKLMHSSPEAIPTAKILFPSSDMDLVECLVSSENYKDPGKSTSSGEGISDSRYSVVQSTMSSPLYTQKTSNADKDFIKSPGSMSKTNHLFTHHSEKENLLIVRRTDIVANMRLSLPSLAAFRTARKDKTITVSPESMVKANRPFSNLNKVVGMILSTSSEAEHGGKSSLSTVNNENRTTSFQNDRSSIGIAGQGCDSAISDASAKVNRPIGAAHDILSDTMAVASSMSVSNEREEEGENEQSGLLLPKDLGNPVAGRVFVPDVIPKDTVDPVKSLNISNQSSDELVKAKNIERNCLDLLRISGESCPTSTSLKGSKHLLRTSLMSGCDNQYSPNVLSKEKGTAPYVLGKVEETPLTRPRPKDPAVVTKPTSQLKNPYATNRKKTKIIGAHNDEMLPVSCRINHFSNDLYGLPCHNVPRATARSVDILPPKKPGIGGNEINRLSKADLKSNLNKRLCQGKKTSLLQFEALNDMEMDPVQSLHAGTHPTTLKLTSTNAENLRFDSHTGLPCGIFGTNDFPKIDFIGNIKTVRRSLIKIGCDSSLLSDAWISNHIRWINWKLASMERRFPKVLAGRYLTYSHVLSQLHRRYKRELCNAQRPAVRKVLNRDIAPSRLMILCVSQILAWPVIKDPALSGRSQTANIFRLELTDGWYAVQAIIDEHMESFVHHGKIQVGTKLMISNATLVGGEDGVDPLDSSYSSSRRDCPVALRLTANATRIAAWNSSLGFVRVTSKSQAHEGFLLVQSLFDVIPGGGVIPAIELIICKRYPRMFLEQRTRDDGSLETRELTEAQEESIQRDFESKRVRVMEKVAESALKECSKVCFTIISLSSMRRCRFQILPHKMRCSPLSLYL